MSLIKVDDLNAATPLSALTSAVTPNELFYLRSHSSPPTLDADTWRLTVRGVSELVLSLPDLQAMSDLSARFTVWVIEVPSAPGVALRVYRPPDRAALRYKRSRLLAIAAMLGACRQRSAPIT